MKAFAKFYDYQTEAKNATKGRDKGIVCLPTGTGKTFLEAGIIAETILEEPGFKTYVINAPRILLSFQLCKEVYQFLLQCGVEARYMFVHSGGTLEERDIEDIRVAENEANDAYIPYSIFLNGTDKTSITAAMETARAQKLPLILISTYNSCERIESARIALNLPPVRLVVNDEAHYLVQERFFDILHTLAYQQCFFFTATTKETPSNEGRGMNNEDAYGPLLYSLEPRRAMDMGRIVRPRIHFVTTDHKVSSEEEIEAVTVTLIEQAFRQHHQRLVKDAGDRDLEIPGLTPTPLDPKMLVSLRGVEDIVRFMKSRQYENMRAAGVDIFAIASNDQVGNNINRERMSRPEFLKKLKISGNDPTKKLLALHFDILTEGIDVNGFTGLLVLRNLTKTKFIQSYGRTARLHPIDRENIEKKRIIPWEWKKQMKPFSYVLIPDIATHTNDQKQGLINLIEIMREYGYDFAEHIIGDQSLHGVHEEEGMESLTEQNAATQLSLELEKLFAEFESEEAAALAQTDPETEFTMQRAIALGLGRRKTIKTPLGRGVVTGFKKGKIQVNTEDGQPLLFDIENILTEETKKQT
jgi:superfamily II DNA or RNA helicase